MKDIQVLDCRSAHPGVTDPVEINDAIQSVAFDVHVAKEVCNLFEDICIASRCIVKSWGVYEFTRLGAMSKAETLGAAGASTKLVKLLDLI